MGVAVGTSVLPNFVIAPMLVLVFAVWLDWLPAAGWYGGQWEYVVLPGSKGLMVRTNEEFHVLRILQTPLGLSYEGTPTSMLGSSASVMPLLTDVAEIPGESETGWYHLASGALEPARPAEAAQIRRVPVQQPEPISAVAVRDWFTTYLPLERLRVLALNFGLPQEDDRQVQVERLLEAIAPVELIAAAL